MQGKSAASKNILVGSLAALGCEILFGISYLFAKQATGQASALALLGWRFVVALAVMGGAGAAGRGAAEMVVAKI